VKVVQAFVAIGEKINLIIRIQSQYVFQEFCVSGVVFNNKNLNGILFVHERFSSIGKYNKFR
jgi:hypothetical protein